jgi:hypothetical protein
MKHIRLGLKGWTLEGSSRYFEVMSRVGNDFRDYTIGVCDLCLVTFEKEIHQTPLLTLYTVPGQTGAAVSVYI